MSEEMELFIEMEQKPKKKVLMYDFHNFMYRCIFAANNKYAESITSVDQQSNPEDLYVFWRNFMVTGMFEFVKSFKPDTFIISVDSRNTWRKDKYPAYKEGRKEKLSASAVDFHAFYPVAMKFISEIKSLLTNVYVLEVDKCETDDVIAVLIKEIYKNDEVIILSTDKDFYQLMKFPNVKVFNPDSKVRNFVTCINPVEELDLKIICGDGGNGTGDNIPNILVMEGVSFDGKTIGVGPAIAKKILDNGIESDFVIKKVLDKYGSQLNKEEVLENVKKNYARNLQLISFESIPVDIKNDILYTYKNYNLNPLEGRKVVDYLFSNKMPKIADDWQSYSPSLKSLG